MSSSMLKNIDFGDYSAFSGASFRGWWKPVAIRDRNHRPSTSVFLQRWVVYKEHTTFQHSWIRVKQMLLTSPQRIKYENSVIVKSVRKVGPTPPTSPTWLIPKIWFSSSSNSASYIKAWARPKSVPLNFWMSKFSENEKTNLYRNF